MIDKKIFDGLKKNSKKIAIIYQKNNKLIYVTYDSLLKSSEKICDKVEKNKLIILLCDNSIETIISYVGLIRNNNKNILIDCRIKYNKLKSLIASFKPCYVIGKKEILESFNIVKNKNLIGNLYFFEIKKNKKLKINNKISLLLSTSGTTGSPKLVKITHRNIYDNTKNIIKYLKINSKKITILTLPVYYSYGLSVLNTHLFSGATIALTPYSLTEKKFWEFYKIINPTNLSFVPFQLELIRNLRLYKFFNNKFEYITQAGGKLNYEDLKFFIEFSKINGIKFIAMYGQTEASPRMSYLSWKFAFKKIGSIGKPIPGGFFYLIDKNGNKINKSNVEGELIYRGKNVSIGIAKNYKDLSKLDDNKGLLKTGDIAEKDKDGFYYIKGRLNRYTKIFGLRINLDELQQMLSSKNNQVICDDLDSKIMIYYNGNIDKNIFINQIVRLTSLNKVAFEIKKIKKLPRNYSGKIVLKKLE